MSRFIRIAVFCISASAAFHLFRAFGNAGGLFDHLGDLIAVSQSLGGICFFFVAFRAVIGYFSIFGAGCGLLAYIIAALVLPEEPEIL